ncbi:protein of unknown function (plasmid) [Cupriavidus taiwanensis]|uniref:Uncharacterized protein n=1 Tax=Cupriavidus taiwanensis TaxID=164546 RepID=A0A375FJ23_9BURK|nr:protein of unknown function [Cupriavidus taiwanensis]SPA57260.1 protein of unknown function [Cupriavidus taiwanensis]SPD48878.1 protein of unknown function [Cupriavidus taiwanensis]
MTCSSSLYPPNLETVSHAPLLHRTTSSHTDDPNAAKVLLATSIPSAAPCTDSERRANELVVTTTQYDSVVGLDCLPQ